MTIRPAACALTLTLIGAFIATSVWTNSVSQQIAAAPAGVEIDIASLTASMETAKLPLLTVRDPI